MMATVELHDQGDIPEFHRQLGQVIRAWADLEHVLWFLVEGFLGVDQFRARIVIGSIIGGRQRRDFVTRLGETYLDPALLPRFRSLMKRMDKLGARRNLLSHALMHINVDGKENRVFSDVFRPKGPMDGGLEFNSTRLPLNDVRALVSALHILYGDFHRFHLECDGRIFRDARIHREEIADLFVTPFLPPRIGHFTPVQKKTPDSRS